MAAHVLTAINQIIEDVDSVFPHLDGALSLGSWTEDLDFGDYQELAQLVDEEDVEGVEGWAYYHREHYHHMWVELGRPDTREQWREAAYG